MGQEVHISMMMGGLDLVTAPIVMDPGKAIAASNYEPDVNGYTSHGGFERYDGRPSPSSGLDPTEIAALRAAIQKVPGDGPVRGVWVYNGYVYAFRDQLDGSGGMFRAEGAGWIKMSFGYKLQFGSGTAAFVPDEFVLGSTSGASAMINRVVKREGAWSGSAAGFLIVSNVSGTFASPSEVITSGGGGHATGFPTEPVNVLSGGRYDFTNHNFYGAQDRVRMYFCSGTDTAFEWNGSVLVPIYTGVSGSDTTSSLNVTNLLAPIQLPTYPADRPVVALTAGGNYPNVAADGANPTTFANVIMGSTAEAPSFVAHYKNHLMLGYSNGAVLNSSLGEPLEYNTTTGAGEMDFGDKLTGLLSAASTAMVVFAQNRIEYLTGDDASNFTLSALTDSSGAHAYTVQMMDMPMFLDDGGVHKATATDAFGDWRMGSVTQPVEPLVRQKKIDGITPVASLRIKAKDQYKLFWEDGTGITVYVGRKDSETLPFKLPIQVFCSCTGELEFGKGERVFVGGMDGYVYEMNRGTSFDGAPIESYIRLPFNAAKSPVQQTRWQKATFEISTPDPITIGVSFAVDYAKGLGGDAANVNVEAGSTLITSDLWDEVDWAKPVEGRLEYHLAGIGPNIAATLIHSSAVARQHTISSQTYNFSRRGLKR